LQSQVFSDRLNHPREFENRELLCELVVHPALAARGRILASDLDAANRIAYVEEATHLSALAVHGKWLADRRLHTKTIEHGSEHAVIGDAIDRGCRGGNLLGLCGR